MTVVTLCVLRFGVSTLWLQSYPLYHFGCSWRFSHAHECHFSATTTKWLLQPLQAIWQAVVHISPTNHGEPAPNIDQLKLGQEMVGSLVNQIYQLASEAAKHTTAAPVLSNEYGFIPSNLPLPLFVLDESETIQFANQAAAEYIGQKTDALIGKNVYMVLDMAFPNKDTLDAWFKESKTTVATASHSWERVRLNVLDNHRPDCLTWLPTTTKTIPTSSPPCWCCLTTWPNSILRTNRP